ncbi:MAG: nicotinate (nicotinamide) nucleotide adenylyltransferase [Deltaproteobacteria bacterium]|nr:nicotinate (nicotinamide) nucleotide adenylyltransferase [Deltaproteobacteria bacterium]
MKIGIFGGSFDPPHIGHMMACLYVLTTTDIQKIWLLPSYRHPFNKNMSSYEMRVKMCEISSTIFGDKVEVKRFEEELAQNNNGPIYTIDVLRFIRDKFRDYTFYLVIGSDILNEIERWKEYNKIEDYAKILILIRRGVDPAEDYKAILPDISSTLIRENIQKGIPITGLVCKNVIKFIEENELYK